MAELRQSQASTQKQLDQRIAEIQNIREILAAKDADIERLQGENRALHDQRNAILSGVSNLQDDLNRLRADTVTLGNDLAAARKERDVMLARQAAAKDAEQHRRDSEVSKAAVSKLTKKLGQSQGIFEEAKAHHIREAKGLLLMIQYLKDRFSREAWFRADLCHQKEYLNLLLQEKQARYAQIWLLEIMGFCA
jgi:septal ring factor EnvC (AmiA/AmiB activator)